MSIFRGITNKIGATLPLVWHRIFNRANVPVFSLMVGSAALSFQTKILYPWHMVLSSQVDRLEKVSKNVELLAMKVEYEACEIARLQAAVLKKDAQILEFETSILEKLVTLDQRAAGAVTDSMPQVCRPPEFMVVKTTILQERA